MKPIFILFAILILTTGCATYGPNNFFTGGYNEVRLAPDVFRITFQGSQWSGAQQAQDFAMLRAADLTVQNGFAYLAIMRSAEGAITGSVTTPGQIYTRGYIAGNNYYGTSTYIPGSTVTFVHPRSGLIIKCFASKPENIPVLDAKFLQRSIRAAYKLPPPK